MIKRISGCIFLGIFLAACHTTKTIVRTTAPAPLITHAENESVQVVDSMLAKQSVVTWLDAKAKISFNDGKNETDFTASIRAKRDSILWFSISPALGIEVARVIIDKDSIRIIDRLHHQYMAYGFDFFKRYTSLPVSFNEMQSIIMGLPLLISDKIFSLQRSDSVIQLSRSDSTLSNQIHVLKNYQFSQQALLNGTAGTLQMICSNYQPQDNGPAFSMWRKIELQHDALVTMTINFTKARYNEPQKFPFDPTKAE